MRFYAEINQEFKPPSYIYFYEEEGSRVFLHFTVIGNVNKCMRCNEEGHIVMSCLFFFCHGCGKLVEKDKHNCNFPKFNKRFEKNTVQKEKTNCKIISPKSLPDHNGTTLIDMSSISDGSKTKGSFSEIVNLNLKETSSTDKNHNMEVLKKRPTKNRTPPTPPSNPKTPQYYSKKQKTSTPENRIIFRSDDSSHSRLHYSKSASSSMISNIPPPSPIDPVYLKEFPSLVKKHTSPKLPEATKDRKKENEEIFLTDDEPDSTESKVNNLSLAFSGSGHRLEAETSLNISLANEDHQNKECSQLDWSGNNTEYY